MTAVRTVPAVAETTKLVHLQTSHALAAAEGGDHGSRRQLESEHFVGGFGAWRCAACPCASGLLLQGMFVRVAVYCIVLEGQVACSMSSSFAFLLSGPGRAREICR